jgi:uncharacterized protein (DUF2249 family)
LGREVILDVSAMACPEPLDRVLEAIDQLKPGCYLHMLHWREPVLLFPILEKRGFTYQTCKREEKDYKLLIWRKSDAQAEAAAHASLISTP